MLITDLKTGDRVTLEMKWGEALYNIPNIVIATGLDCIMINPFNVGGRMLDLGSAQFRNVVYNLYCHDKSNDTRMMFKGIVIELVQNPRDKIAPAYYKISTRAFVKIAVSSERRENQRIPTDANATLVFENTAHSYDVHIRDVSDNGIAFYSEEQLIMDSTYFRLSFADTANGHEYGFSFKCRLAREQLIGNPGNPDFMAVYGCVILNRTREYLEYVCLKKMLLNAPPEDENKDESEENYNPLQDTDNDLETVSPHQFFTGQ